MILEDNNEQKNAFETQNLPTGDYTISGTEQSFIIERKEYTDFIKSYRDGRLYNQLNRCIEQEEFEAVLLLEGNISKALRYTGASRKELFGAIGMVVALTDLQVIQTADFRETQRLIKSIHRKIDQRSVATPVREQEVVENRAMHLVVGLPGVGEETAKSLLEAFGTPREVFTATEHDLTLVDGIGETRAQNIIAAVNEQQ